MPSSPPMSTALGLVVGVLLITAGCTPEGEVPNTLPDGGTQSDGGTEDGGADGGTEDGGADGGTEDGGTGSVGTQWIALGDSETVGRATGNAKSQVIAFETIYNSNGLGSSPALEVFGEGGRPLRLTALAFHGGVDDNCTQSTGDDTTVTGVEARATATWVHFQESGNQNHCGQRTAQEFGDTFEAFVRRIRTESPNAVISTETAYSFQREATAYRDWSEHNLELQARVASLGDEGIHVHVADVDGNMKLLVQELGFANVILPDGGHFREVGNLLVALTMFESLGHDVRALDLSAITQVSASDKVACVDIVADP